MSLPFERAWKTKARSKTWSSRRWPAGPFETTDAGSVQSALGSPVGGRQRVGVFVPAQSRVRRDPTELELGPVLENAVELLHELEVFDLTVLSLPAARFPTLGPHVHG